MRNTAIFLQLKYSKNGIFDDVAITSALHNVRKNLLMFHQNASSQELTPKIMKIRSSLPKIYRKYRRLFFYPDTAYFWTSAPNYTQQRKTAKQMNQTSLTHLDAKKVIKYCKSPITKLFL